MRRSLRRHRRRVVSSCATELRAGARLMMEDWRKRAAAHADYSGPDPLLQMAQIHGLLFAVEALATWTLTLGLPQPMEMKKLLAGIQAVLEPAPSPLPA